MSQNLILLLLQERHLSRTSYMLKVQLLLSYLKQQLFDYYKYNYGYNYTDYESYTDDEDEENEAANAEGKVKRGPSMASRVLPNLIPRIQTKRLPSKPASETKPPETPEST